MNDTSFQREVLDRLIVLETLLKEQDFKGLNEKVEKMNDMFIKDDQTLKNHEVRLAKLEDNNKWLIRLVAGALILGVLAFVYGM